MIIKSITPSLFIVEPEPEESIEPTEVDTTHAAVKSSIDGNFELDSAPATMSIAPSKIKINITKPITTTKEPEESKEPKEKSSTESLETETTAPLVPVSIKPGLQGRKLSVLPPVQKGEEMSGLCTIM